MLTELSIAAWGWPLLALATLAIGFTKTAIPGANVLAVAIFAAVLPAKTSTAGMLLLLILGDACALLVYRRHAHWPTLLRLAPAVLAGVLLGFVFLLFSDDDIVRRTIGVILLLMVAMTLWRRRTKKEEADTGGVLLAATYGTAGGFTTMVANAGGPVMSLYFLAARTPMQVFLGTSAWFFAIVNLVKVPFLAGLGLFTSSVLWLDLILAPAVLIGAFVGTRVAKRMNQQIFDRLVLGLTIVGAIYLLF